MPPKAQYTQTKKEKGTLKIQHKKKKNDLIRNWNRQEVTFTKIHKWQTRCTTSLVIWKMQKTAMSHHYTHIVTAKKKNSDNNK